MGAARPSPNPLSVFQVLDFHPSPVSEDAGADLNVET